MHICGYIIKNIGITDTQKLFPFYIRLNLSFPLHALFFRVIQFNISRTEITGQVWMSSYNMAFVSVSLTKINCSNSILEGSCSCLFIILHMQIIHIKCDNTKMYTISVSSSSIPLEIGILSVVSERF